MLCDVSNHEETVVLYRPLPSVSSTNSTNSVSIETQCNLHNSAMLEVQFKESLQANSKLAEQLGAAKKEIELLKGKLKELEVNGEKLAVVIIILLLHHEYS